MKYKKIAPSKGRDFCSFKSLNGDSGHVGVDALIPIQEAQNVNGIADLEVLDGVIDLGGLVAEIALYGEGVCCTRRRRLPRP